MGRSGFTPAPPHLPEGGPGMPGIQNWPSPNPPESGKDPWMPQAARLGPGIPVVQGPFRDKAPIAQVDRATAF